MFRSGSASGFVSGAHSVIYERFARATAFLISLYALDVLVPVIDIFGLPVPRYVASMSFSFGFILAALGILISMARMQRIPLFGSGSLALVGLLVFWAGIEAIGALSQGGGRIDLILAFIPLLLVMMAARLHLILFKDPQILLLALVLTASALALAHTMLLLGVSMQIDMLFVNLNELQGRNLMALLVPVCLWLLALFPLRGWPVLGYRYNMLFVLALSNILLSQSRAALLILAWCVFVGIATRSFVLRGWLVMSLIPIGVIMLAVTFFAYPITVTLNEAAPLFIGQGDDAVSVWSRSQTNFLLLQKLGHDPLLGIGWQNVAETKAFGYMGHSLNVIVLAAYGAIGAIPLVGLIFIGLLRMRETAREAACHLLFLMAVLIAAVTNDVFAYFGVVIALLTSVKDATSFPRNKTK